MYQGYEHLQVERRGKIVTVTLNRPEVRNATNPRMHQELERIFPEIGRDPDANVVIVTGAGTAFSAGGDIAQMKANLDNHARWNESMGEARRLLINILDLDRPVIARINGHAIGLGATLALFCDVTIALDTARICDPHVEALDARVNAIAEEIAAAPAVAVRTTKRALNLVLRQQLEAVVDAHLGLETMSHLSLDHREAVTAFTEKRSPVFTGR
jgi:enoyl-CoA hydratase